VLVKFKIESYYIDHRLKVWKHLSDLINNIVHTVHFFNVLLKYTCVCGHANIYIHTKIFF